MSNLRLIARLDVKAPDLIKGIHLEGWRKVGDPQNFAERYYADGIDEIIYLDAVASLYQRNTIIDLVRETAKNIFVPITVGGGIRSIDDVKATLRAGADKVAINTAAIQNPELVREVSRRFGSQCLVLSIQAKRTTGDGWEALCDLGRERTGRDAVEWAQEGQALGAGEILVTSVDREGTRKGFDIELVRAINDVVNIPVIASGGMGSYDDLKCAVSDGGADGIAMAHVLHYGIETVDGIRRRGLADALPVRPV